MSHDFSAKVKFSASIFRKSMSWIWDQNSKAWGRPWDWNCKTETRLWDKNCKAPEPSKHRWVLDYQTACSRFSMSTRVPPNLMIAVPANLRHLKGVSVFKFWDFYLEIFFLSLKDRSNLQDLMMICKCQNFEATMYKKSRQA